MHTMKKSVAGKAAAWYQRDRTSFGRDHSAIRTSLAWVSRVEAEVLFHRAR